MRKNDKTRNRNKRRTTIIRNKLNYISGTMSPADIWKTTDELESFRAAMEYYRKNGIEKVVVQPKYMGSRCQVYLSRNIKECRAVTRNGYLIGNLKDDNNKPLDIHSIYEQLHSEWFGDGKEKTLALVILDGELLPWSFLGQGLIDDSFYAYHDMKLRELNSLKDNDPFAQLNPANVKDGYLDRCLHNSFGDMLFSLELFKHQIDIYSNQDQPSFKPFNVLKKVYNDGHETISIHNNEENSKALMPDEYVVCNTSEWKNDSALSDFMINVKFRELEGVVVKPCVYLLGKKVAPYLKVRNFDYLRMVYGDDFQEPKKYQKLMHKKRVSGKIKLSIEEYMTGCKLLEIPYSMLSKSNENYISLVEKAVAQFEQEQSLDPRL